MLTHLDCIPCFQRQALQAARFVTKDLEIQEMILRKVMEELVSLDWTASPPTMARRVHRIVREVTGADDPYREAKVKANELVLKIYPELKREVKEAVDPLLRAIKLAIAGNIIDLGAADGYDLEKTLKDVRGKEIRVNDYENFKSELMKAKSIIYLADNSGEIVFDKLLLETILGLHKIEKIKFVVKGAPIINDATEREALEAGLGDISQIEFHRMGTGVQGSGDLRESPEFGEFLKTGDMVISKGQGNFEGLSHRDDVFFLLIGKCPVVAGELGAEPGDLILKGGESC